MSERTFNYTYIYELNKLNQSEFKTIKKSSM